MDFSENPYESPIIAELVERPRPPAKKRRPFLALVLFLADVPLMAAVTGFSWFVINWHLRHDRPSDYPTLLLAGCILFGLSAISWLAGLLCLKELVQFARGR